MYSPSTTDPDHILYRPNWINNIYFNTLNPIGIIEPIQFSDWAAPTVAVLKANGELQACGELAIISLP